MNPAEEIVKFWLQEKGVFLQSSIRLPQNKELDILAINPKTNERFHIEVGVSVRCANYKKSASEMVEDIFDRKFKAVKEEVEKRLGKSYKKIFVVGNISFKNKDVREEFVWECKKREIEVVTIQEILDEIRPNLFTHTYLNAVIKAVQIALVFK